MGLFQLPNEILQHIANDLEQQTVSKLCLTSRTGYHRFLPVLYQRIELGSRRHISQLREAFRSNVYLKETVMQCTHTIVLKCRQGGAQSHHWRITVSLLQQLPNVTRLYFQDFNSLSIHNVQQALVVLPKLLHVSFEYCDLLPSTPSPVTEEPSQEALSNSYRASNQTVTTSPAYSDTLSTSLAGSVAAINHTERTAAAAAAAATPRGTEDVQRMQPSFLSSEHRHYCINNCPFKPNSSTTNSTYCTNMVECRTHNHYHCSCWCSRVSLTTIKTLVLNWTDFTEEAIQQLYEAMPNLNLIYLGANHNRKSHVNNAALQYLTCFCSKIQHLSVYLQQIEEATLCKAIQAYGKQLLSLAVRCNGEETLDAISTYSHRLRHLTIRCNYHHSANSDLNSGMRQQNDENPSVLSGRGGQSSEAAADNSNTTVNMILQSCEALEYLEMIGWPIRQVPTIILERVHRPRHVEGSRQATDDGRRHQQLLLSRHTFVAARDRKYDNNIDKGIKLNALDLQKIRQRIFTDA